MPDDAASRWIVRRAATVAAWDTIVAGVAASIGSSPPGTRVLKSDRDTLVLAASAEGRDLVCKCWRLTGAARLKAALRRSRAWRHWAGADRLTRAGVRAARCLAIVSQHTGNERFEWLVMERLPGTSLLEHLRDRDLSVEQEHALAAALGRAVGTLARAGLWNRDPKPSNWIVTDKTGDLAVIDTVAIRSHSPFPGRGHACERMLASLVIEPIGCGVRPRRSLMCRALHAFLDADGTGRRPNVRALWRRVGSRVASHGDAVPRVDPLRHP